MKLFRLSLLTILLLPLLQPVQPQALAQQKKKPAAKSQQSDEVVPQIAEPVAPYDDKLLRLSEILGAIHYLRALCGVKEDNRWRNTMNEIIESEEPGPKRRSQLISNFKPRLPHISKYLQHVHPLGTARRRPLPEGRGHPGLADYHPVRQLERSRVNP